MNPRKPVPRKKLVERTPARVTLAIVQRKKPRSEEELLQLMTRMHADKSVRNHPEVKAIIEILRAVTYHTTNTGRADAAYAYIIRCQREGEKIDLVHIRNILY